MKLVSGLLILFLIVLLGPRVLPLLLSSITTVGLLVALLQHQIQAD